MANEELCRELAQLIIDFCNIEETRAEEISLDSPLLGPESPFGLDSLDAVEIVVAVQKRYGARIGGDDTGRMVLQSLRTLSEFVERERR